MLHACTFDRRHVPFTQMKSLVTLIVIFVLSSILESSAYNPGSGYEPQNSQFDMSKSVDSKSDKKTSGWFFHKPKKDNVKAQLAYAQSLENEGKMGRAKRAYNDLVHQWNDTEAAVKSQQRIAHILYDEGKYNKAFKEFQYLVDYYAGQFNYKEVIDLQIKIANYVMGERRGDFLFFHGYKAPERALPLFKQIIVNAPNLKVTPAVRLKVGGIYEDMKQYEKAISVYDAIQQFHALSDAAEIALFRKSYCLYILAKKAPRDEKRCRSALSSLASFLSRYKMSSHKKEAEGYLDEMKLQLSDMYYNRALFYDEVNKMPKSALIAYRDFLKKFPSSERAQTVYSRVVELEKQVKKSKE